MSKKTIEKTLWVCAFYDKEGAFQAWLVKDYKPETVVGDYGFFVPIRSHTIELPLPDRKETDRAAFAALGESETKLRARLQMELTTIQVAKNRLLGLAAPEVLDAPRAADDPDGIPF